jgi:hypothetical protein
VEGVNAREGHHDDQEIIAAEVGRPSEGAMLGATRRIRSSGLGASMKDAESMKTIAFADPLSDCGVASVEAAERLMQGTEKAKRGVGGDRRRRFKGNPKM